MMLRKTKIICTLGPAVDNEDMIRALIRTGMNAARFNFSHGSHEEHLNRLNLLKSVRDSMGRPVASILDTKGPEIRIRSFETKSISLEAGDAFTLTTREVQGNGNLVSVTYPELHKEVSVGQEILIDDGLVGDRRPGHPLHRGERRDPLCQQEHQYPRRTYPSACPDREGCERHPVWCGERF